METEAVEQRVPEAVEYCVLSNAERRAGGGRAGGSGF